MYMKMMTMMKMGRMKCIRTKEDRVNQLPKVSEHSMINTNTTMLIAIN